MAGMHDHLLMLRQHPEICEHGAVPLALVEASQILAIAAKNTNSIFA